MVPTSFLTFFAASAGAGGALIGLLFVAISISPDRIFKTDKPDQAMVATSAFTALVNAFFISLGALIPEVNIPWIVAAMAFFGLSNSLNMGARLFWGRGASAWATVLRRVVLVIISVIIYGYEAYVAIRFIPVPHDKVWVSTIAIIMLAVYGLGLMRAWELLGAPRYTLLSWLSPMHDVNRDAQIDAEDGTGATVEAAPAKSPATVAQVETSSERPAGR